MPFGLHTILKKTGQLSDPCSSLGPVSLLTKATRMANKNLPTVKLPSLHDILLQDTTQLHDRILDELLDHQGIALVEGTQVLAELHVIHLKGSDPTILWPNMAEKSFNSMSI